MTGLGDPAELDLPWTRSRAATAVRRGLICGVLGPISDLYTTRTVVGREHLRGLGGPVVFVANHASHLDTPVILRALPQPWRRRTSVAAAADYFYADRRLAALVSLVFGTVPLERSDAEAIDTTIALIRRLVDDGRSLLLYAEGTRSRGGEMGRLRPGAALLAVEHGLPIVPIHVSGTQDAMPIGRRWPTRSGGGILGARRPLEVRFGQPIRPGPDDHRREVMERVRSFLQDAGAQTASGQAS